MEAAGIGGTVVETYKRLALHPAKRRWWAAMIVSTTITLLTAFPLLFH
ncbi:MAG: hypothetical protein R2733_10985 [Acidimicrobiales bacterium]